jgi:23S rRNA methylase
MEYLISSIESDDKILKGDLLILDLLRDKLNYTKSKIDNYFKEWEIIKKVIHDYEYVYCSSYIKKNVSNIFPVSRSYFKLREIFYNFNMNINDINNVCSLAEAPGGFIQSLVHLSGKKNFNIYANSLLSKDRKVPMWNNKIRKFI